MKLKYPFCLLLIGSSFLLRAQNDHDPLFDDLICHERENATIHLEAEHYRNYAADQTDMVYQEMHWEVDPAVIYIKGLITYHFKSRVAQLTSLVLDLANTMQVHYVKRGDTDLAFVHSNDKLLTIDLGKTLSIGEDDSLTISYEGTPVSTGLGSFLQTMHNGHPLIETESVPYGVRDWWPGKQDLVDKVDSIDVYITTPMNQMAASCGSLVSITEENGKLVHHWRHRHPIVSYLIAMAITNYSTFSDYAPLTNGDSLLILNYVYPESFNVAQQSIPDVRQILNFYNDLFGLYPYADEKYGHAQWSSGGTEIQTMSFVQNFSYDLLAHEMAHQWFGDKVTCGSYRDVWLSEGFATYLQGMTVQQFFPADWHSWLKARITSVAGQSGGSVWVEDTTNVARIYSGRLSYNKASYLLHMLRWMMGDAVFFQACRNYLEDPKTAYGFARTADLQHKLEEASGLDLTEFFADWFTGQGYPSYTIDWYQLQDSVSVGIHQAQSHPSVSFFEMPLPVWLYHNGIPEKLVLPNTHQDQLFTQYVGDVVIDSLVFDPELWILSVNNKVRHLSTATHDVSANDVIHFYPNPANQEIKITNLPLLADVMLIDLQGKQYQLKGNSHSIDLSSFADGLYWIKVLGPKAELLQASPLLILH